MTVEISGIKVGGGAPVLVAGPCAIEGREMALAVAETLADITAKLGIPYIFKGSYDKANRLSLSSGRGLGFPRGLEVLREVREKVGVPVLTDVHETYQVEAVASVVDVLQIPAFLCRQTDLLLAAAKTKKPVNIKKGQFVAPQNMKPIAQKAEAMGNKSIILTERGTCFGYNDLVFDPRSVVILKGFGYPVLVDVTHLCQRPGASGGESGGTREFVVPFGRVAMALGADGIYMEVHPSPHEAISDRDVQIPLAEAETVIRKIWGI